MNIGSEITGKDINNTEIQGTIKNILPTFGIVQVRTGDDRTNITHCNIKDISTIN